MNLNPSKISVQLCAFLVAFSFFAFACGSGPEQPAKPANDTVAMKTDSSSNVLDHLLVDNKKDPSCGMPVSAGINDTTHYKGKVLGFCSKECKETFAKNPEGLIAAAELKK